MQHWDQKHNNDLTDDNNENKKAKLAKKCIIKQKLTFADYKHCFEATQLENEINHLEENEIDVNSLWENHREFIKVISYIKITGKI